MSTPPPPSVGRSAGAHFARTVRHADVDEAHDFLARAAQLPTPGPQRLEDLQAERAREREAPVGDGRDDMFGGARTPGGVPVRVCRADAPTTVVVNVHASGWVRGLASWTDGVALVLRDRFAVTTLAPDYRLAPEHPHPAGRDDVLDTIRWAVREQAPALGVQRVVVLGSSAGAHLSMLALLRAREQDPELLTGVRALVLSYGIYDLSRTPSMRSAPPDTPVVAPAPQAGYLEWAFGAMSDEQRRTPDLSPLYADLTGLPPALFTACERDPLRDDSLFMAERWADAGNDTDLDVWAECVHSFDRHYPTTARRYAERVGEWITAH